MKKPPALRIIFLIITALYFVPFILFDLVWNGVVLLNNPSRRDYPVRGVDVSHYQGEIDWQVLSGEDIDFAFIKATEGSGYTDDRFGYNLSEARKTDLLVGAYHFFSFDSPGSTQAEHFINTVPRFDGMLPPVIDVEFYGDKIYNPPSRKDVCAELDVMIATLTEHYGFSPILYATEEAYDAYLSGAYCENDIWIRNVIKSPTVSDGRRWTFWQYTNRGRLHGYSGEERFIDLNVFAGSREEFEEWAK